MTRVRIKAALILLAVLAMAGLILALLSSPAPEPGLQPPS